MEPQQKVDWAAVRQAALACLDVTWDLVCWAGWAQEGDYNADRAALHLKAIDRARGAFKGAAVMFSRALFDTLTLASVGEGPRPDFRFGSVCCATAHETAYELLRRALLWLEDGLYDLNIGSADELHGLSADALQETLSRLEKGNSAQSIVYAPETHQVRAWIDREWAAVSQAPRKADVTADLASGKAVVGVDSASAELVERLLKLLGDQEALMVLAIARDRDKTVNEKLYAIAQIDRRYMGYNSTELGDLLQVDPGIIRQSDWWKRGRKQERGPRDFHSAEEREKQPRLPGPKGEVQDQDAGQIRWDELTGATKKAESKDARRG